MGLGLRWPGPPLIRGFRMSGTVRPGHPAPEASRVLGTGLWWKPLEHVVDVSVQRLSVLLRIVAEVLRSQAPPEELLGVGVEQVDGQVGYTLIGGCGCGLTHPPGTPATTPAPSAPTPAAAPATAHTVVHGLELFLVVHV